MRAAITSTIGAVLLAASMSANDGPIVPIAGGKFEASGAVALDGGVLFVDDSRSDRLFWMAIDDEGRQKGTAEAIPLGVSVPDMEGMTTDGTYVYVVGSQSKKDWQSGAGLARFKFDVATKKVTDVQTIADLKTLIFSALPDVQRAAGTKVGGLNIEGLAWDPTQRRLLLGLRAPALNGEALVIPLKLTDANATLARENVGIDGNGAVRVAVAGGIRSIEYDAVKRSFVIISGAASDSESAFGFWRWSGQGAPERENVGAVVADAAAKPEGITRFSAGPASYTFVVFDTSRYAALR